MEQKIGLVSKDIDLTGLDHLDNAQYAAATAAEERNVVVRAPAGSGKTSVAINAIALYRYNHVVDTINAITYTNAAVDEMSSRLRKMGVVDVPVMTIHKWSLNWLKTVATRHEVRIEILNNIQIKSILTELANKYSRLKRLRVKINVDILMNYIINTRNMNLPPFYRQTFAAIDEMYQQYKRSAGLYDPTDYPQYLYDLLVEFDDYIEGIDALFIDEFQDVDEVQKEIFDRVKGRKFVIGDEKQSIYQFRGADGQIFQKLDGYAAFVLDHNYRSYQDIIDYANAVYYGIKNSGYSGFISNITTSTPSRIICDRGYGGNLVIDALVPIKIQHNQAEWIQRNEMLRLYMEMRKQNVQILCRTNREVGLIQSELDYQNVSTVHQAKGLEYDNVIVIDSEISSAEDLNIAYVALTRARDNLMVLSYSRLLKLEEAARCGEVESNGN